MSRELRIKRTCKSCLKKKLINKKYKIIVNMLQALDVEIRIRDMLQALLSFVGERPRVAPSVRAKDHAPEIAKVKSI